MHVQSSASGKRRAMQPEIGMKKRKLAISQFARAENEETRKKVMDLRRLALSTGMNGVSIDSLLASHAAANGALETATQYARRIFTHLQSQTAETHSNSLESSRATLFALARSAAAFTATQFATETHAKQSISDADAKTMTYALELLRYALSSSSQDSLQECIVLSRHVALLSDIARSIPRSNVYSDGNGSSDPLYSNAFKEDPVLLPYAPTMQLATHYCVSEHRQFISQQTTSKSDQSVANSDFRPSKRLVSFLVEQKASLLCLKVLLSMQKLPLEADIVIRTQHSKLLATIFQSAKIDAFYSLGLGTLYTPMPYSSIVV